MSEKSDRLFREMEVVERSLPRTHHDLIAQVDRFIFGAQRGFDLATEYLTEWMNISGMAKAVFNKEYALQYAAAEASQIAPSTRREYAVAHAKNAEIDWDAAELQVEIGRLKRDRWLQLLNTFKKIKGDNTNFSGGG